MVLRLVPYAVLLAAGVFALEWAQRALRTGDLSAELMLAAAAFGFAGLGLWAGSALFVRAPSGGCFERNTAALHALKITPRELDVLEALAAGLSNKEIARRLGVSPNTVKTQVASLYAKLEVSRRMAAVEKARMLSIIS